MTGGQERPRVAGWCPACGLPSLFLYEGGHVRCGQVACTNRGAAGEILADRRISHVAVFTEERFTLRHPLRERLGDALLDCEVHERLAEADPPPPGRYMIVSGPGVLRLVRMAGPR